MRILHIEDNVYKHHDINKVISGCGRISVDWVTSLNGGIKKLEESFENNTLYDLIITDMYYPIEDNGKEVEAGEMFISEAAKRGWNIPIILCSSVSYVYPEIYASIHYSPNSDWEIELRKYIKKFI